MRRSKLKSAARAGSAAAVQRLKALCEEATEGTVATILLPEVLQSKEILNPALKILGQQKRGHLAFALLQAIRRRRGERGELLFSGLNESTYAAGIASCARSKLWQHALNPDHV